MGGNRTQQYQDKQSQKSAHEGWFSFRGLGSNSVLCHYDLHEE
jgi:hypothetical protein